MWGLEAETGVRLRPEEWAGDLGHVKEFSSYPMSNRESQWSVLSRDVHELICTVVKSKNSGIKLKCKV